MSKKLWVAYETPAKTIVDKVSIDGCSDVEELLKEIKKKFQVSIPQNTTIALYQPDGTTGIDVEESPTDYLDGNSSKNPLIVKTYDLLKSDIKEKAEFELYSWKAKRKPFQVLHLDLHNGRIPLDALLAHEKILYLFRIDDNENVLLLADKDGFSIQKWESGQTMPKDAAVLVTLAEMIHSSLPQVVAQAAALLFFRRGTKPPRGCDGSGGPIVFIRTDGEEWIFSKMVCEDGVLIVEHSQVYKINIFKNDIENDILQQIFDWLRYAITIGRDSMSQVGQTEVNDEETLTTEFSTMLIDINGELSEF